ncbi:glyoxalase [Massilia arenosa]|uniref:Glyoxalase n=1 Tax=Zemynaea arenosa TaxID=2561931 RepID=A0A4Y9STU9_9BURK|nr:VOC family protein [Massilia arenosa]TFW28759.1 glyoxalase [Massilia arenosa]
MTEILGLDHVQVAIPAGAEEEARAFYGGLLGMTEIPKPSVLAVRGGCWFQCGMQQLHIGADKDFHAARKAHPALLVRGLAALRARLQGAGCQLEPGEALEGVDRWMVYDPFGNRVELVERLA